MAEVLNVINLIRRRNYSSSDDESSDDDWESVLRQRKKRVRRPRVEDYARTVVARYMDHEFKSHFRLIGQDITRKVKGSPTLPAREQLMIALWRMATMDSYRSVCDRFDKGRATALRSVRRVSRALFRIAPQFIQWPSGDRATAVMLGFEVASGFPKTIGSIDGTHIRIDAPKENPADYINRKGFHSLQLQLVCDHRMLITHCYAGHPGSLHDQRVFRNSEVAEYLNDDEKFLSDSHLVGDAAYELHRHLLTPFKDNGHLTARQRNFNFRQSSTRVVIERCIGLLKGRMRCLLHCLPMQRIDLMAEYIVACCVIHNICILRGDELQVVVVPEPENQNLPAMQPHLQQGANINEGVRKRNVIMDMLLGA